MCLSKAKRVDPNSILGCQIVTAYKVMDIWGDGSLHTPVAETRTSYIIDKWYTSNDTEYQMPVNFDPNFFQRLAGYRKNYTIGYHCFGTLEGAEAYQQGSHSAIFEVEVSSITANGYQTVHGQDWVRSEYPAIVGQKIKFIRRIE